MYENPATLPGEYYHNGQWIPAEDYRNKVRNVVNNIDNPNYNPAQDGFYFGEGANLQAPFWRLFQFYGEARWGTFRESLPSGAPNPFAHLALESPAIAPEMLLGGLLPSLWRAGVTGMGSKGVLGSVEEGFTTRNVNAALNISREMSSAIPSWSGSGPTAGVLGVNGYTVSVRASLNYYPKGGIEFVFDSKTGTFVTGNASTEIYSGISAHMRACTVN